MKRIKNFDIRTDISYDTAGGYWLDIDGTTARIGMSPLVQETSGAFVAIRMENTGRSFAKGESFGSVEAEKHVGQLIMPLSGTITAVNEKVLENPALINKDPYGKGWLIEIELAKPEDEQNNLLSGETEVSAWFESEITRYKEKGWLADPVTEMQNTQRDN
ncbi:MAG: glycine cleavage system protein H [Bacteroidetes bacterium]|nr:MAG: glycine cleavage system protein H [Bacteroidota bacterium]